MPSEHMFEGTRNHKSPLFWIIMFAALYVLIRSLFDDHLARFGFAMQSHDIEVDEDLPNVFHALTKQQADAPIKTNGLCMERYGFEFQDPDTIEALKTIRTTPEK